MTGAQKRVSATRSQVDKSAARSQRQQQVQALRRVQQQAQAPSRDRTAPRQKAGRPQAASDSHAKAHANSSVLRNRIMFGVAAVVALLVVLGVGDLVMSFGKVHPGVVMQGVEVGGLSKEEASAKLVEELTPQVDEATVTMYENADIAKLDGVDLSGSLVSTAQAAKEKSGTDVNGDGDVDKWRMTSETLGVYVDGDALAEEAFAVGRSGNFLAGRIGAWLGQVRLPASVSYSLERYNDFAAEVNKTIGEKVVNSRANIEDGVVTLREGNDGYMLNQGQFSQALSASVFGDLKSFAAPMEVTPRNVGPETGQRIVDQVSNAISQDVVIKYKDDSWTMDTADLGNVISQKFLEPGQALKIGNGKQQVVDASELEEGQAYDTSAGTDASTGWVLQAFVDQKKFDAYLVKVLGKKAKGGAKDAQFYIKKNKVKIKPSEPGKGPNRQEVERQLQDSLFGNQTSVRTLELTDTTIEPDFTTQEAESMGIKDRLAKWSIPLSGSSGRMHNIKLLCKLINNSLTAPGASWSFNGTTGERTEEKGFKTAPVIINGRHEDQLGGGVCQVATCVFNCACYSGLGINKRVNHDFYIPAYDDKGFADATVSWDVPDLEWVNDTSNYILLTASVSDDGDVVVQFWGTDEGRTVTCDRGKWKKGAKAKTIRESSDELPAGETQVAQTPVDGRSIKIHYVAKDKDGSVLHDIMFNSEYTAQNEIILVGTKGASSSDSKKSDGGSSSSESGGTSDSSSSSSSDSA